MDNQSFVAAICRMCASQGKSLTGIAVKYGWTRQQMVRLFEADPAISDSLLGDLACELALDPALLRALLGR